MATQTLAPIIPTENEFVTVNSPWQGQGLDVWHALVRNLSPYALIISVSTSTYWLGPFEQDYYEFPEGVYSFGIIPQLLNDTSVPGTGGSVLVTAFDQSSSYDGAYPVALSPPALQQTFSLIATGSLNQTDNEISGSINQSFDAIVCYVNLTSDIAFGVLSDFLITPPVWMTLTSFNDSDIAGGIDAKGRFTSGDVILACSAPGLDWAFSAIVTPDADWPFAVVYELQYRIYGVTIADTQGLLGEPQSGSFAAQDFTGNIGLEPNLGPVGTQLCIDGWYDGAFVLQIIIADGGEADSPNVVTLIDDPTNSATRKNFSFQRPDHAAWILFAPEQDAPTNVVLNVSHLS